jgi:lysophospholipase L1-like esterase
MRRLHRRPRAITSGTEGSVSASNIRNASKIAAGIAALKTASSTRQNVVWLGHSIIQGVCSDNTTNQTGASALVWRTSSMPAKVLDGLNTFVGGSASYGIETFAFAQRDNFTLGGSAVVSPAYQAAGPGGYYLSFSTAAMTASFVVRGSAIRVLSYASATGIVARYQINGGSVTNATASGVESTGYSPRIWYEFLITGLTSGDTVTLVGASSGSYTVFAIDLDYKTTAGITMHRNAYTGLLLGQLTGASLDGTDTNPTGIWTNDANETVIRSMQGQSLVTRHSPALVICTTDCNDIKGWDQSGSAYSWTVADHKRHLTNLATFLAGYSLQCLFVTTTLRDPSTVPTAPYTQDDIINAYKQVSDEQPNMAILDLTHAFAPGSAIATRYAAQQASGYIQDAIHPNAAGAIYYAGLVTAELTALMV